MILETIVMTKEALIERLQEQLPLLRARDERLMAQHRKDEQDNLKAFRAALREMLKWDYAVARHHNFELSYKVRNQFKIDCPVLLAPRAEQALEVLAVDRRKRYTLTARGSLGGLFELVTWTENPIDVSGGCR